MLDTAWRLTSSVALRPEPFGALAYHFGNRRLTFLKRQDLTELVKNVDKHRSLRDALRAQDIPEAIWPQFLSALRHLVDADMIAPLK